MWAASRRLFAQDPVLTGYDGGLSDQDSYSRMRGARLCRISGRVFELRERERGRQHGRNGHERWYDSYRRTIASPNDGSSSRSFIAKPPIVKTQISVPPSAVHGVVYAADPLEVMAEQATIEALGRRPQARILHTA